MQGISRLRQGLRRIAPQAVLFCVLFYFAYHLVEGERGMRAWVRLDGELATARAAHARLTTDRAALEQRVNGLRGDSLDADLLEEQARRLLNLGRQSDIVVLDPSGE